MASGREQYAAARRKAQARRPADPQAAAGVPDVRAEVAELMRPCATPTSAGVCGDTGYEHNTGTRAGEAVRTGCSISTAAGPCGCPLYTPARSEVGTP